LAASRVRCSLSRENRGSLAGVGTIPYRATSDSTLWFHFMIIVAIHAHRQIIPWPPIAMPYQETDPLLPRNNPAPEIQGSRPQSINEVGTEDTTSPDVGDTSKPRMGLGDIYALLFGLITLAFFAILLFPDGFKDVLGDGPQTIDERVNNILTRTPLIGSHLFNICGPQ
jgi:hypothetical protein